MVQKVDVFICHASQDKNAFVRPLAESLRRLDVTVWFDEFSLKIGDSVSGQIDKGIANAKFGIVVLSKAFLKRPWPEHEYRGLVNRDIEEDLRLLPIWHGVTKSEVARFSPSLSDKFAIDTQGHDAEEAAIKILRTVRPDLYEQSSQADLERLASGDAIRELQHEIERLREQVEEFQCPKCSAPLITRVDAPMDDEQKHWDVVETYECGLQVFGGVTRYPCPSDPLFPSWNDYKVVCQRTTAMAGYEWRCDAWPKTEMARKVHIECCYGHSEDHAREKIKATYLYRSGRITNTEWMRVQMDDDNPQDVQSN